MKIYTISNIIFSFIKSMQLISTYLNHFRYIVTGILFPLFDIGSDLVTAGSHFYFGDASWGILTLCFVALPGLVAGLSVAILGLRKNFTFQRLINFTVIFFLSPILYPIGQICV